MYKPEELKSYPRGQKTPDYWYRSVAFYPSSIIILSSYCSVFSFCTPLCSRQTSLSSLTMYDRKASLTGGRGRSGVLCSLCNGIIFRIRVLHTKIYTNIETSSKEGRRDQRDRIIWAENRDTGQDGIFPKISGREKTGYPAMPCLVMSRF